MNIKQVFERILSSGGRDASRHPAWGSQCTHCMGCISVCPQQAIQYGSKTEARYRNWNDAYRV